uniref:Retrotransposon gag domain-containing protein n=1 Tax=Tanacetum cinerariifolium TaxID=118510 RepID=A0A699HGJ3_TANCI|nr:hypothetical protein [Tanacetum cinerariifolium]
MKQNGVSDDALRLSLFPYSLTHHATAWYDRLPRNSIHTFDNMMRKFLSKYFPPSLVTKLRNEITRHQDTINVAVGGTFMQKTPEECYKLIENMTTHHTIGTLQQLETRLLELSLLLLPRVQNARLVVVPIVLPSAQPSVATLKRPLVLLRVTTIRGVIPTNCKNDFETTMAKQHNELKNMMTSFLQMKSLSGSGSLPSNTLVNPRGDLKAITTRSGVAYDGPTIPPTPSLLKEVKRETEATKDNVQATSSESTTHVQPPVVQVPIHDPEVAPKTKTSVPYPSRLSDQKLHEKANNQMLKVLQIFQRLHLDISFTNDLLHMPKFAYTFKSLLSNKEKLFELASTPLNENCSAVLLKKLPKNLETPTSFSFRKLSLPKLTPTRMTLEFTNRSVAYPETFLRTTRALIDVHSGELTLRANDEPIRFKVGDTSRYSCNYYEELVNQIDVMDVSCEEYAQEVLRFLDCLTSGNPTPSDPIITYSSPSFTPFEGSDFILEEIETFLRTPDELSTLNDEFDPEGDISLIEKLLNEDPSPNLPLMKNEDLKQADAIMMKSSIEEPPDLKIKDLPCHLEYSFLKGTDKLTIIISKGLKDEKRPPF